MVKSGATFAAATAWKDKGFTHGSTNSKNYCFQHGITHGRTLDILVVLNSNNVANYITNDTNAMITNQNCFHVLVGQEGYSYVG